MTAFSLRFLQDAQCLNYNFSIFTPICGILFKCVLLLCTYFIAGDCTAVEDKISHYLIQDININSGKQSTYIYITKAERNHVFQEQNKKVHF